MHFSHIIAWLRLLFACIILVYAVWLVDGNSDLLKRSRSLQFGLLGLFQSSTHQTFGETMAETSVHNVIVVGGSYVGLVITQQQ